MTQQQAQQIVADKMSKNDTIPAEAFDQLVKEELDKDTQERQDYFLHEQIIKECYARLYELGCNKEQVRGKLEYLSRFFGNIGSISDITTEQAGHINYFLNYLKLSQKQFKGGILQ